MIENPLLVRLLELVDEVEDSEGLGEILIFEKTFSTTERVGRNSKHYGTIRRQYLNTDTMTITVYSAVAGKDGRGTPVYTVKNVKKYVGNVHEFHNVDRWIYDEKQGRRLTEKGYWRLVAESLETALKNSKKV